MSFNVWLQIGFLIFLVVASSLFSLAEIAVMSVNRYRLRHLVREKDSNAMLVSKLLERPDRLLGAILIGDTFSDILATSLATVIAVSFFGRSGVMIAATVMTLLVLVFGQMIPKTLAALYPQKIALTSAMPLTIFLRLIYPLVWFINVISNTILGLFNVHVHKHHIEHLSAEELRTIVYESGGRIPASHKGMLLRILDLGEVTVEDVMVPRSDIVGIDLDEPWHDNLELLHSSRLEYLPVYHGSVDHLQGVLSVRRAIYAFGQGRFDQTILLEMIEEAYFIPEGTSLNTQLLNFRHNHQRMGLVVDEYGDIHGLVTLEDILEEIVGEFARFGEEEVIEPEIRPDTNGSFLVDGSVNVRELNRQMNWHLPTDGPKTLSGLIIEALEFIPNEGLCLRLAGYPVEILTLQDNMITSVRIYPALWREVPQELLDDQ